MRDPERNMVAQQVIGKFQMDEEFRSKYIEDIQEAIKVVSKDLDKKVDDDDMKFIATKIEESPIPFMEKKGMQRMIREITERADQGYNKVQSMSQVLFGLGIGIIIVAIFLDIYGIFMKFNWQPLVASSGVLGGIGVLTVYQSTYKLPDKVKNSVADLVQIKLAFLGYLDQLSTLMQLNNDKVDDAIKIVDQIGKTTDSALDRIQNYCETGQYSKEKRTG